MNPAIQVTQGTERCPWCDSPISRTKFLEIERGIRADEQRKAQTLTASLQEKFRKGLADARQTATKEARDAAGKELAKVVAEKDAAMQQVSKLKAQEEKLRQQLLTEAERK